MTLVLVVEDNAVNRDVLGRRLTKRGYTVKFAKDGQSGVRRARELVPDIILMDMGLGELDGFQATSLIKSYTETASIPIIAVTASAFDTDRKKAFEAGCDAFETKPIDLERLLSKMEYHLNSRETDPK